MSTKAKSLLITVSIFITFVSLKWNGLDKINMGCKNSNINRQVKIGNQLLVPNQMIVCSLFLPITGSKILQVFMDMEFVSHGYIANKLYIFIYPVDRI